MLTHMLMYRQHAHMCRKLLETPESYDVLLITARKKHPSWRVLLQIRKVKKWTPETKRKDPGFKFRSHARSGSTQKVCGTF